MTVIAITRRLAFNSTHNLGMHTHTHAYASVPHAHTHVYTHKVSTPHAQVRQAGGGYTEGR
jgi:hypothetical protein